MSQTFGRRVTTVAAWGPSPTESVANPTRAWKPVIDPELEAWTRARTGARWKTWGMAGLITLGGPLSFLAPPGIGQWAGFGLTGLGIVGLISRFAARKPDATPPSVESEPELDPPSG